MNETFNDSFVRYFLVLFASIFLQNCGNEIESAHPKSKFPTHSAIPTKDNFDEWRDIWDGTSWIIANSDENINNINSAALSRKIAMSLQKSIDIPLFENKIFDFSRNVGINVLHINTETKIENISAFTVISFPDLRSDSFKSFAPFLFNLSSGDKQKRLMNIEWSTLSTLPDVAWFEPNLQSELFDYTFPPELSKSERVTAIFKRIRVDSAWQNLLNSQNLPRFEYEKDPDLPWTNVAVIDTGVDYLHTDLYDADTEKSRIFTNPNETLDGLDNDGNGYIDDIFGIDASMEKSEWNKNALNAFNSKSALTPGAADVGGPGGACPQPADPALEEAKKCGHGTRIAGLIAAKPGGEGADSFTVGICPSCRIYSLRVAQNAIKQGISVNNGIDDISQIRAIMYLVNFKDPQNSPYIKLVNMSLGKYFISRSLAYWFRRLYENDILVVASAGNDDTDTPSYPAAYDPVLSVCATSESGERGEYSKASFSNFGSWVDICAPGTKLCSILPGASTQYSTWCKDPSGIDGLQSGTSLSCPLVTGAAGFIKSAYPEYKAKQITEMLLKYANAEKLYFDPGNSADLNPMNVLYWGWFADKTRYFLLGTGFLDLGASVTDGLSCARNVSQCKSFVFDEKRQGQEFQLKDGCVVSSATHTSWSHILASMPFFLVQFWVLFSFFKRFYSEKNKPKATRRLE